MSISRSTELLTMAEYASSATLVPPHGFFSKVAPAAGTVPPWPISTSTWAFIPAFQRGIAWTREEVADLVNTSSEVLGTTVWGRFPWSLQPFPPETSPGKPGISYPPSDVVYLTDGLQRFSIATAILMILDGEGLFTQGPLANDMPRLAGSVAPIHMATVRFNHHVLANYPRPALAQQYLEFHADLKQWVDAEKTKTAWHGAVERFFLDRQVGVDVYSGFSGPAALASNFVGINTGAQQLGMVDIFRAELIEDGLANGWQAVDALNFDTEFTEVLVQAGNSGRITPLVSQIGRLASSKGPIQCLPSFRTNNGAALKDETDELLERLSPYTSDTASALPYSEPAVLEVLRCGKLPLSILCAWDLGASQPPWYLINAGPLNTPAPPKEDLVVFARSVLRLYLAGLEGRQTDMLVDLLTGTNRPASLLELADKISRAATNSTLGPERGIDEPVEKQWLEYLLRGVSKRRAARIFSACELPVSFQQHPSNLTSSATSVSHSLISPRPSVFRPAPFGIGARQLQVDHLIPAATGGASQPAEETLRNFAPVPAALNRQVGMHQCADKLKAMQGGNVADYEELAAGKYIPSRSGSTPVQPHPYVEWLVHVHAKKYSRAKLNSKKELEGSVGEDRLQWFLERLTVRL